MQTPQSIQPSHTFSSESPPNQQPSSSTVNSSQRNSHTNTNNQLDTIRASPIPPTAATSLGVRPSRHRPQRPAHASGRSAAARLFQASRPPISTRRRQTRARGRGRENESLQGSGRGGSDDEPPLTLAENEYFLVSREILQKGSRHQRVVEVIPNTNILQALASGLTLDYFELKGNNRVRLEAHAARLCQAERRRVRKQLASIGNMTRRTGSDDVCAICLEQMRRGSFVLRLDCKHDFHPSCIRTAFIHEKDPHGAGHKCPLCRSVANVRDAQKNAPIRSQS